MFVPTQQHLKASMQIARACMQMCYSAMGDLSTLGVQAVPGQHRHDHHQQQPGEARRGLYSSSAAAAAAGSSSGQQTANASTMADSGKSDATAQCDEVTTHTVGALICETAYILLHTAAAHRQCSLHTEFNACKNENCWFCSQLTILGGIDRNALMQVLDSLRKTRSAYTRSRAPYGEVSWGKRVQQLSSTAVAACRTVLAFVLSVPGRVRGFIALSSEERGKVYAGWWAAIKKEGRHYWVSAWPAQHCLASSEHDILEPWWKLEWGSQKRTGWCYAKSTRPASSCQKKAWACF